MAAIRLLPTHPRGCCEFEVALSQQDSLEVIEVLDLMGTFVVVNKGKISTNHRWDEYS